MPKSPSSINSTPPFNRLTFNDCTFLTLPAESCQPNRLNNLGLLDEKARSLIWASGGHDLALWYHNDTKKIEEQPNTDMPVSLMKDASFKQAGPVVVGTGDVIVIGTAIVVGVNLVRLLCLVNDPDG